MNLLTAFLAALRALGTNWLRSMLTMLGIIIGVAAVITMIAIGGGAQARVEEQMKSLGTNVMLVLPGAQTTGGVRLGAQTGQTLTLSANSLQRARADATTNFTTNGIDSWVGLSVMDDAGWRDASAPGARRPAGMWTTAQVHALAAGGGTSTRITGRTRSRRRWRIASGARTSRSGFRSGRS